MKRLILREATIDDKEKILAMIQEIEAYDNNFEGLNNISKIDDYNLFLEKLEKNKHKELIKPEYAPQTTYFAFDEEENIVGGVNIRHELKGNLINHGGNIGYLIRPSKRGMGYGSEMLSLALEKCIELGLDKVLISCRTENIGSAKVIKNNSGVYENNYYDELNGNTYKRYWIVLENKKILKKFQGN